MEVTVSWRNGKRLTIKKKKNVTVFGALPMKLNNWLSYRVSKKKKTEDPKTEDPVLKC